MLVMQAAARAQGTVKWLSYWDRSVPLGRQSWKLTTLQVSSMCTCDASVCSAGRWMQQGGHMRRMLQAYLFGFALGPLLVLPKVGGICLAEHDLFLPTVSVFARSF